MVEGQVIGQAGRAAKAAGFDVHVGVPYEGRAVAHIRDAGVTTAGALSPQRTQELSRAVVDAVKYAPLAGTKVKPACQPTPLVLPITSAKMPTSCKT